MNIFYQSHVQWFENLANGCIWTLILAFVAFMIWLGYDLITTRPFGPGSRKAAK